jgi:hypothetical protein
LHFILQHYHIDFKFYLNCKFIKSMVITCCGYWLHRNLLNSLSMASISHMDTGQYYRLLSHKLIEEFNDPHLGVIYRRSKTLCFVVIKVIYYGRKCTYFIAYSSWVLWTLKSWLSFRLQSYCSYTLFQIEETKGLMCN